jgi:hypothetical protein
MIDGSDDFGWRHLTVFVDRRNRCPMAQPYACGSTVRYSTRRTGSVMMSSDGLPVSVLPAQDPTRKSIPKIASIPPFFMT